MVIAMVKLLSRATYCTGMDRHTGEFGDILPPTVNAKDLACLLAEGCAVEVTPAESEAIDTLRTLAPETRAVALAYAVVNEGRDAVDTLHDMDPALRATVIARLS